MYSKALNASSNLLVRCDLTYQSKLLTVRDQKDCAPLVLLRRMCVLVFAGHRASPAEAVR